MSGRKSQTAEDPGSNRCVEIIRSLNEDLARERKAIIQYMVFSSALKGTGRGYPRAIGLPIWQEFADSLEVARKIDYLGETCLE